LFSSRAAWQLGSLEWRQRCDCRGNPGDVLVIGGSGGPIVVLGALWSWWKSKRYYNLLIAVGALIPSSAGALVSQGIGASIFPIMNILGLVLIFLGYVYSRSSNQGRAIQGQHQARGA